MTKLAQQTGKNYLKPRATYRIVFGQILFNAL